MYSLVIVKIRKMSKHNSHQQTSAIGVSLGYLLCVYNNPDIQVMQRASLSKRALSWKHSYRVPRGKILFE